MMADTPNQPGQFAPNLPQKKITITGESSARMFQNTVRVSRLEQRSIQLAMAPAAVRDAGRRVMDRMHTALSAFEAELAAIEKDIEATGRSNGQRNGPRQQRQTLSRNDKAPNNAQGKPQAGQANGKPGKPQQRQKDQSAGNAPEEAMVKQQTMTAVGAGPKSADKSRAAEPATGTQRDSSPADQQGAATQDMAPVVAQPSQAAATGLASL